MNEVSCPVANLDAAGRRARRAVGFATLGVTLVLAAALVHFEAPRAARFAIALPIFGACLGFLQARMGTCVVFAARDVKSVGRGIEPVSDRSEAERLREQGVTILIVSAAAATVGAVAFWLLPI